MSRDDQVASLFVHAVENAHVPVENAESSAESILLTDDVVGRNRTRSTLKGMIRGVDVAVGQIDVKFLLRRILTERMRLQGEWRAMRILNL